MSGVSHHCLFRHISLHLCAWLCGSLSRPLFLLIFSSVGAHNKSVSFHLKYLACFVRPCALREAPEMLSVLLISFPLFRIDKRAAVNFSCSISHKKATFHSAKKHLYFYQTRPMHLSIIEGFIQKYSIHNTSRP